MTLIVLLFALGVVLLAVEVIVPGGILGSIGALLLFAGCVTAYLRYGAGGGTIALISAILLTLVAFYIEFRVLPKTAVGRKVFLNSEIKSSSSLLGEEARDLIGKTATSLTMLSPSGYVSVDGRRYEAFCQSGQVPAGTPLDVISADNFRIIVSETKTN